MRPDSTPCASLDACEQVSFSGKRRDESRSVLRSRACFISSFAGSPSRFRLRRDTHSNLRREEKRILAPGVETVPTSGLLIYTDPPVQYWVVI